MNDKNNNNIVTPQSVDTNINVPNNDTMLNRERTNIVSATIQANNAIDKKQALEVNNEIKTEKHHGYMFVVVIVTIVILSIGVGFIVYKLLNAAVTHSDKKYTTTTATTTSQIDRFNSYLRDYSKVRKFVGDNYILLLSIDGCDLKSNKEHYLLLHTSNDGLIDSKSGTYTIENNTVKLDKEVYEYTQDGINFNDTMLKIYDSEMKYYQYKDNDMSYLLIINATMNNEFAMFIASDKNNIDVKLQTFKETQSSIILGDSTVFTKVEGNITYNNYTLTLLG